MWWKRYEPILEQKAVPVEQVIMDLLAKELCEVCEAFPPAAADVQWENPRWQKRFAHQLKDMPKIDLGFVELLAKILRHDLAHETDAVDHLFRNDLQKDACPSPLHEEALHFLWPALIEVLLARKEELKGRFKTKHLLTIVDRFEARFRKRRMLLM